MTWIVMPGHANSLGTVFGGQVMAWIDVCAAVSAQRFCRANVVTAAMDQLVFEAPVRQGEIAVLQAMVNWAGRTSMEVGVRVESEHPHTGLRLHTATSYVTFVAVDADGRPTLVPRLVATTDAELRRYSEAEQRRADRLAARERLLSRPPRVKS
jgi:acyl-CoA hydrolase